MPRITRAYLEENHADLVEEFRAEGRTEAADGEVTDETRIAKTLVHAIEARGAEEGLTDARAEAAEAGATAERERILGIQELVIAGHEELAAEAVNDPKVTPEVFAVRQVKAEQNVGGGALAALKQAEEEQDAPDAAAAKDDYAPEATEEGQATRLKSASPRLRKQAAQK